MLVMSSRSAAATVAELQAVVAVVSQHVRWNAKKVSAHYHSAVMINCDGFALVVQEFFLAYRHLHRNVFVDRV